MNPFTIKTPIAENNQHLSNLHEQGCLICGKKPVEAAHIRFAAARYAKPITGTGTKPRGPNGEECYTVPLCNGCHQSNERSQHRFGDEQRWWGQYKIEAPAVSQALWICRGHPDLMERICENNRHEHTLGRNNRTT